MMNKGRLRSLLDRIAGHAAALMGLQNEYAVQVNYRHGDWTRWYFVAADESLVASPERARWYSTREQAEEAGDPTWLGLETHIACRQTRYIGALHGQVRNAD